MPELIPFLAKLTLWCALPFALRPLLARRAAATRHLVLTLTLSGTLVLPILLTATPRWLDLPGEAPSWLGFSSQEAAASTPALQPKTPRQVRHGSPTDRARSHSLPMSSFEPSSLGTAIPSTFARRVSETLTTLPDSASNKSLADGSLPLGWLLLAWVLGAVGASLHTALQLRRAHQLVQEAFPVVDDRALAALARARHRLGIPLPTRLRQSPDTPVPFAWRGRSASIVLPTHWRSWDTERLTVVLVHELAHLRRKDSVALWLGRAATAVWWFHPLVHGLDRWARQECERAADDAVLLSGSRASDYAGHLLAIGRALAQPLPAGVSLMMSKSPDFKQRLTAILRAEQPRQTLTRRLTFGAIFLALAVAVTLAGVHFGPSADAQEGKKSHAVDYRHDHRHGHGTDHEKDFPQGAEGVSARAMEAHQEGRYTEAIAGFEAAAAAGRRPAVATYNAACGYSLLGRSGEALDALAKALDLGLDDLDLLTEDSDLDPLRADPRFQALVDEAFAKAGETRDPIKGYRYRTALERVDLLRQANSQDAHAWSKAGRDLLYMGEPDLAVEAYSNALRLDPEPSPNTIYNLACVYAMDGQKAQALKTLRQAVEGGYSNPDHILEDPDLASLRGDATFKDVVALAQDLDLDRYRSTIWEESLGETAWKIVGKMLGDTDLSSEYDTATWAPAIEFYQGFVEDHPKLGAGWFNLGYSLHYSKRFTESIAAFEKAGQLGYRPSVSTYNVACGLSMLDRVDDAMAALERSTRLGIESHQLNDHDLDNLRDDPRFRRLSLELEMAEREHSSH